MPDADRPARPDTADRETLAAWMIAHGFATGHGDTTADLLHELEWQVAERAARDGGGLREVELRIRGLLLDPTRWGDEHTGPTVAVHNRAIEQALAQFIPFADEMHPPASPAPALDAAPGFFEQEAYRQGARRERAEALLKEWADQWEAFGDSPMSSIRAGLLEDTHAALAARAPVAPREGEG